jgi:polyhydroxybutyrate depolymerase
MPLTFLGAQGTFEAWAEINGCTDAPTAVDADGCSSYSACNGGAEVVLCTQEGGSGLPGDPTVAWPVLNRHSL